MRKDVSDVFTNYNEGKVLVMDNPFAQTNASHLLKPLMDMAKKDKYPAYLSFGSWRGFNL